MNFQKLFSPLIVIFFLLVHPAESQDSLRHGEKTSSAVNRSVAPEKKITPAPHKKKKSKKRVLPGSDATEAKGVKPAHANAKDSVVVKIPAPGATSPRDSARKDAANGSLPQNGSSAKRDTSRMAPVVVRVDTVKLALDTLRKLPNNAFGVGEHLHYNVKYGFVNAGDAYMTTYDTILPNGRRCYNIHFNVDSKPVFNWVYKVYDRYSTIVDAAGLFPWRFEQHISEGGYRRDFWADFDQVRHIARTSEKNHQIPSYVQDIMSAFYFARTIDYAGYRPGQLTHFQNFYKDSTYDLDVKYKGRQQIEVDAGTFNCIIVEPIAREGGLFKANGRILIWLSDDERKIPIRVRAEIPIGSVDSELIDFQGINGPLTAKVND